MVDSLCADGRRGFKPYLDAGAVDVAIIDCLWNGAWEGMKIAAVRNSSDFRLIVASVALFSFAPDLSCTRSTLSISSIINFDVLAAVRHVRRELRRP